MTDEWITSRDAILSTNIRIGDGVGIPIRLVSPEEEGRYSLGITNSTIIDRELGQELILGHQSQVQYLGQLET